MLEPEQQFNRWASMGSPGADSEDEEHGHPSPVTGDHDHELKTRLRNETDRLRDLKHELQDCLTLASSEKKITLEETKQLQQWIVGFFADGDLEQVLKQHKHKSTNKHTKQPSNFFCNLK
jgi:hypothetical protein